jgi:hypothetical protein
MSAAIQVVKQSEGHFQVTVQEGGSRSSHLVSVTPDYARKLTSGLVSSSSENPKNLS